MHVQDMHSCIVYARKMYACIMYACMHVSIHTCAEYEAHLCMQNKCISMERFEKLHKWFHVCMRITINIWVYIISRIYACVTYIYIYIYAYTYVHVTCVCARTSADVCMHIDIFIYVQTNDVSVRMWSFCQGISEALPSAEGRKLIN